MRSAIFMDGKKFAETEFKYEPDFERIVKENSTTLFGEKTVFSDLKNKVETKTLGSAIPDGFLFDFKDVENPDFYLVEVERREHDFYKHIFPQVTKFFAFFKNTTSRNFLQLIWTSWFCFIILDLMCTIQNLQKKKRKKSLLLHNQ